MKKTLLARWHQQKNISPTLSFYALVDGLQYERYFHAPIEYQAHIAPLFRQVEDAPLAFAGPWLFKIDALPPDTLEALCQLAYQLPAVSWIFTSQDETSLLTHLAQQLNITLPDGQQALFRYYDPRILHRLATLLDEKQQTQFFADIVQWHYFYDEQCLAVVSPCLRSV